MWNLLPAHKNHLVKVKEGGIYRAQRGTNVEFEFEVKRTGASCNVDFTRNGNIAHREVIYCQSGQMTLACLRRRISNWLNGMAIYEWEAKCPNGVTATPEGSSEPKFPSQKFIIWCPQSDLPPRVVLEGEDVAINVAKDMAKRHHKTFYWARLEGFVESKKVTTYTEVMKTL